MKRKIKSAAKSTKEGKGITINEKGKDNEIKLLNPFVLQLYREMEKRGENISRKGKTEAKSLRKSEKTKS